LVKYELENLELEVESYNLIIEIKKLDQDTKNKNKEDQVEVEDLINNFISKLPETAKILENNPKILETAENLLPILGFNTNSEITLAGRLKTKRVSGKIAFGVLEDESLPSGFQVILKANEISDSSQLSYNDYLDLIDDGDYLQLTGKLGKSQRGEPSLFVSEYKILTKALRRVPNIDYKNIQGRFENRVADMRNNTKDKMGIGIRDIIILKSKYWQIWREEMMSEGFLEIETPVLRTNPSGAEAKPFVTYHNDIDQEVFLRMELELYQKRMIAGGFEKTFEIGKQFRNEGSSPQHLQEYTQIEWYGAYLDYNYGMRLTKRIHQRIVKEILGREVQTDYYGSEINWGDWCSKSEAEKQGWKLMEEYDENGELKQVGWPMIEYFDAVRYFSDGKIDTENKTAEELVEICHENGIPEATVELGIATLLDKLWKKARLNTTHPFFLYLPPVELEPLAKRDSKRTFLTQRFQLVAGRAELGKGFSELNDPVDQFGRFEEQQKAKDAGNDEAMEMDESYIEAMEYGMPPLAGWGCSERTLSFLLGKHIKECVPFPLIKENKKDDQKSKRTLVAHSIILDTPEIPLWSKLNTASHLSASLAAREGKKLIWIDNNKTVDGENIPMNIQHAIINKKIDSPEKIRELKKKAEKSGLVVTVFTKEMRDSKDDQEVTKKQQNKTSYEIEYLGVLIFGKKTSVENITNSLENF